MIVVSKILSLSFLFFGIFILLQVLLPIISFQIWQLSQQFSTTALISPQRSDSILGVSVENTDNFPAFVSHFKRDVPYTQFEISIPKLKLRKEEVLVDSNDLSAGLAHLPGTALPGERGNVFISGHSALSPFIKKSPFAKLADLKKGDRIEILAMGTKFNYEVLDLKAVPPNDLSVINPPDQFGRYISLMTCVPPGLNFKRLVILGKLI